MQEKKALCVIEVESSFGFPILSPQILPQTSMAPCSF